MLADMISIWTYWLLSSKLAEIEVKVNNYKYYWQWAKPYLFMIVKYVSGLRLKVKIPKKGGNTLSRCIICKSQGYLAFHMTEHCDSISYIYILYMRNKFPHEQKYQ